MIPELLLATKNKGKIAEIVPVLEDEVKKVASLLNIDDSIKIAETETTFEGNAKLKAETLFNMTGKVTLADDSGLEVDALEGEPGVYSARFAGSDATDEENNRKLLSLLADVKDEEQRTARFRCVMALVTPKGTETFEGKVEGHIAFEPAGDAGFGYDPVFVPSGYRKSFAELGMDVKNKLSHRSRALEKVVLFLKDNPDLLEPGEE